MFRNELAFGGLRSAPYSGSMGSVSCVVASLAPPHLHLHLSGSRSVVCTIVKRVLCTVPRPKRPRSRSNVANSTSHNTVGNSC
eukprot:4595790-Prymnesium_polylepis.1